MEIAIADIDKTPTWYIVGTDIFLSFENPGPITIDPKKLTPDQVTTIRNAANQHIIVAKGLESLSEAPSLNKSLGKSYATISSDIYKVPSPIVTAEVTSLHHTVTKTIDDPIEHLDSKRKELKTMLKKPMYTVKKNLMNMGISELKLAFELETSDKARASVLTMINDMITKFNREVSAHIAKNESKHELPKEKSLSPQLTDIIEEDTGSIEVSVGDNDNN